METKFNVLLSEIDSILNSGTERDQILSGICELLKKEVYHYDWVGFYLADPSSGNLVLGPFSGKPTDHKIIPFGKGVCGQVAESKTLKVVQDVTAEENYLSCSIDVQSEIVVPVLKNNKFMAELDIDSHSTAPFTKEDEKFLQIVCEKVSVLF
jgi:GAF domain-containing protein